MEIHWIIEKYGEFLYQSDETWNWMQEKKRREKEEKKIQKEQDE